MATLPRCPIPRWLVALTAGGLSDRAYLWSLETEAYRAHAAATSAEDVYERERTPEAAALMHGARAVYHDAARRFLAVQLAR